MTAGGTGEDIGHAVDAFEDGSLVVAGSFVGTADFAGERIVAAGSADVFVSRVDAQGGWSWTTPAGGSHTEYALDVSALEDGGAVVTGFFYERARFGDVELLSAGLRDAYVARIDATGRWLWAVSAGGAGDDEGVAVDVSGGEILVAGNFRDRAQFGATELLSAGNWDIYVGALTLDGTWLRAVSAGGPEADFARSLAADGDSLLIAGEHAGVASFGDVELRASGGSDFYVARLDGTRWIWASGGGSSGEAAFTVHPDGAGGAVVAGHFYGVTLFEDRPLVSAGAWDAFVARIDATGRWLWAVSAGGPGDDAAAAAVVVGEGAILVTGRFREMAMFGPAELDSAGGSDLFVATISPDGRWVDAAGYGASGDDAGLGVAARPSGGVTVVGFLEASSGLADILLTEFR